MMPIHHVFQIDHQLSLNTVNDLCFRILFILHPFAVKCVLVIKCDLYKEWSHWCRKIEEFNMGSFVLNVSLKKSW